MQFLTSYIINSLMLDIYTPDGTDITFESVAIDLWDFVKSQLESKITSVDYVDLLKCAELLNNLVKTGSAPTQEDINTMRPIITGFIERISLLAIKCHLSKKMNILLTMPSSFYFYGNKTSASNLYTEGINIVQSFPYVDDIYTYMDLMIENDIKAYLVDGEDLSYIDYTFLSANLFLYKQAKQDIIVFRGGVLNEN